MTTGYPAILILDGRLGVVIGGGSVAERKVHTLLDAGAKVRVVADEAGTGIRGMADRGEIELVPRRYASGDVAGAAVAIAATDDVAVNQEVYEEAVAAGIPVNVVDDTSRCTFIAPSIVRRGDLLIAISTGGKGPALAVRLRERLEREIGEEYGGLVELLGELRLEVSAPGDPQERAAAWYRVVDSDVLDLVRAGRIEEARARARELLLGG